jgi:uncharacterized glyoxalase superfamily protein PhnB
MPELLGEIPSVIPMLSYEDVAQAADWVAQAFGFRETGRWADADGHVTHVNMELGGGIVMLGSAGPHYQSPRHHAELCDLARAWSTTPYVVDGVLVYVDDIERTSSARKRLASPFSPRSKTTLGSVSGTTGPKISRATAGCSLSQSERRMISHTEARA